MTDQLKCRACGADATTVSEVHACDECQALIVAALAALRPDEVVEPNGLTPARRGALRRAREIGRWAAQATAELAREDLTDDQLDGLMERTNSWWAASQGKASLKGEQCFEVMALLMEVGGKLRRGEATEDEALALFSRSAIVRWPELELAHADLVRQALVAAAAKKAAEWSAATRLLTQLGLVRHGTDQESLRRQFYSWLDDRPAKVSAILGKRRSGDL